LNDLLYLLFMSDESSLSRRRFVQLCSGSSLVMAAGAGGLFGAEKSRAEKSNGDDAPAFPGGFVWGAATSSYQIEGAAEIDGKGPSVWDVFSRKPGAVWQGQTGDVACDHYHRYAEDVSLMKDAGLQAYRFSISWPRVLPEGIGRVNRKGLDFYDRLVDELLSKKIEPWVTLFHWDFPQALFEKGGWTNPESPRWFEEYTRVVVERLSDRVTQWMTFNEPQVFIGLGHLDGLHAPGLKMPFDQVLQASHHVLLAHGLSAKCIRTVAKKKPEVGCVIASPVDYPISESAADIEAGRLATLGITRKNVWNNTWWTDPVVLGRYPEDGLQLFGKDLPKFSDRDFEIIRQPLDFLGLNIYQGGQVRAKADGSPEAVPLPTGSPLSFFHWPVTPESLRWGPRYIYERYKTPIFITENGMSNSDWVALDGKVHDPQRVDFLDRYLSAFRHAIEDGVDGRGYFTWSFMDNFEWAEAYKQRFGLIHVDFETLKRTPKESSKWYSEVIRSNGRSLAASPRNATG
jgi:beta-glucosidase